MSRGSGHASAQVQPAALKRGEERRGRFGKAAPSAYPEPDFFLDPIALCFGRLETFRAARQARAGEAS